VPVRDVATPSPAATARRAQVVAASIEVIAANGYRAATFARIAARAGLSSTRLISYHFADKADLMAAVVGDVIDRIGRYVGGRTTAASSPREALAAYITAVVDFVDEERASMTALLEIVLAGALGGGEDTADTGDGVPGGRDLGSAVHVEEILRRGVAAGDFRAMDVSVVAVAVQRAVEGLPFLLRSDPDLDCAAFGRELVTVFDLATRPGQVTT
jgi:AcrR family transcriptional regulator